MQSVDKTLAWALPIARHIGVTRIADISYLDPAGIPVVQCTRPSTEDHFSFGQNTGSQGKGTTLDQASVSALMESIETFCLEPRGVDFIRGSFQFLKNCHAVVDPSQFILNPLSDFVKEGQELLWFKALHLKTKEEVLVPAESVFFPLKYKDYNISRHFFCGSNGVASGFTYLEAVTHALYEVIERFYFSELQFHHDRLEIERVPLDQIKEDPDFSFCKNISEYIKLYRVSFKERPNISFNLCLYSRDDRLVIGKSCGANFKMAAQRAVTEAVQVMCSIRSGAREDLVNSDRDWPESIKSAYRSYSPNLAKVKTMSETELLKHLSKKNYVSLHDEYSDLLSFLSACGFENVFVANLSRYGVDVPVVKVIIPNMPSEFRLRTTKSEDISTANSNHFKYGIYNS